MDVVLDTCALVWAASSPEQLSERARQILADPANGFVVSAISLWEIAVKVKRGSIDLGFPVTELAARLRRQANVTVLSVDVETWLANVDLEWDHRDPADRTIVAVARARDLPIVTCDKRIAAFYARTLW